MNLDGITVPFADLSAQFDSVRDEVDKRWTEVFSASQYIGGPLVKEFEHDFGLWVGVDHVIACGNGTDALELALAALSLPPGSSVVVAANSFIATAEAVSNVGFTPRFVDVGDNFHPTFESIIDTIEPSTAAVIWTHLYGYPTDLTELAKSLRSLGVHLLEDCAQAHGGRISGKHVGAYGAAAAFSFYPGKNLGALGDAGAVVTNDAKFAEKVRRLANHGRLDKFDHHLVGRNSRMDALQAAVLSAKLTRLDHWVDTRRKNANLYLSLLARAEGLTLPPGSPEGAFHHFVVQHSERGKLRAFLSEHGVATGIHYPQCIPDTKAFTSVGSFPNASKISSQAISLPVGEHLSNSHIETVTNLILSFSRGIY